MGTTLDNGIYLPDEGERNCYEGLAGNWVALDNHLGSTNIHVTINDKQAWDGHVADTTIHVTSADKQAWNGKADASALTAHTGDTTIHVTSADKQAWDGHVADSVKHVTAEDKNKWDAVTSKADDSDVVHKSGNETISGVKTFEGVDLKLKSVYGEYTVSSGSTSLLFYDKNSLLLSQYKQGVYVGGIPYQNFNIVGYDSNNQQVNKSITFSSSYLDLSTAFLKPETNNAIALGRTINRWSDVQTYKVNALEPSSLGMPSDRSARIDISSYFTNTGTGQSNSYTVPANGYIYLTLSELTNVNCFSRSSGNVTNYAQTFTKLSNSTGALYILFPVRKNDVFVATWYTTTTVSVDGAFFIPCRGNI